MAALQRFLEEARRRRVFRVAGIYVVAGWLAVQVASEALPALDLEAGAIRYVWLAVLLGFPLALVFGWFFDVSPAGIVRTPPAAPAAAAPGLRRTDYLILAALAVIAAGILLELSGQVRETAAPRATPADPLSIAVLPLDNLSGDPEQAWFAAGMHDALISALSRVSGLRVTSRTSTKPYADSEKSAPEIGAELGVARLVEGSVYRAGDRVRIIVQLIDATRDDHLWEQTFERELTDVLRLQSDITRAIAGRIQVELTRADERSVASAASVVPGAYEAYLKGQFHTERFTPEDMRLAADYYRRAVELDPESPLGHWGLYRICGFQVQAGLIRPREGHPKCRASLLRAFELDDTLAEVHMGLALSYWLYDYNWPAADAAFRRSLELNPSYAEARMFYAHFLAVMRKPGESTVQIELARELDPLNVFVRALHGAQVVLVGDTAAGVAQIEDCLREVPALGFGFDVLWFGNARLGRWNAAYEAAVSHFGITMGQHEIAAALVRGHAAGGYRNAMREGALAAERVSGSAYVPAVEISLLWEMAGDADKAFEWLDTAYDWHDPTLPYIAATGMMFALDEDPRFRALLERMDLAMWIEETAGG